MKKQLRLALLAALIFVVAMMTVFMASATEAPAPGATDNYQVVTGEGVHVDYYATLSEALAGITADGYKIVVLKDVTEATGVKLNIAHTYTITGGTGSKTITFTAAAKSSRGNSYTAFLDMTAGAVTLENLKLVTSEAVESTTNEYILLNGATALTLDSVEVNGGATKTAFLYIKKVTTLTVKGATKLNVGTSVVFMVYDGAGTTVKVQGGSFEISETFLDLSVKTNVEISNATVKSDKGALVAFTYKNAAASSITVGGNVVFKTTGSVFKGAKAMDPVSIVINSGFKASGEVLFDFTTSTTKKTPLNVTFNGGELHLVGSKAVLANAATIFAGVTYGADANKDTLKIYFDGGAKTPDAAFDTAFDWSKFSVLFSGFEGSYEIGEGKGGVYNLTSFNSDFYKQIKAELNEQVQVDTTRFPYADVDIAGWIPITVNCADAVLNISGEYDLQDIAFLVKVIAGTVNVDVTCKNAAEPFLILEGGTLNVTGGTYTKKTPFSVAGGTLNITGGTFSGATLLNLDKAATVTVAGGTFTGAAMLNITGASTVTVSGGTFTATDAETAFVAVEAAATLNIAGGTFVANGAKTLFKLNNADAVLNITGGTFEGAAVTVHALLGSLSMSGGSITVPKDGTGILIDGAATVNIAPNAENAENDPVISLLKATYGDDGRAKGAIVLTANSDEAALTISGGKLGNVTNVSDDSYMYAIYQNGKSTINISGGELYGANSAAAIDIYGGSLNITGGTFYGYRNVRLQGSAAALNITGGTFNSKVGQVNNILIDVSAANSVVNIAGATFNNFTRAIYVGAKATITVADGIFNQGTYSGTDSGKNSWIHIAAADVSLTLGKIEEGVSSGPVVALKQYGRFVKLADSAKANIVFNGGSFVATHTDNVLFELGNAASVNTLAINGGSFGVLGQGAALIPRMLDKSSVSVTGGEVTLGEGTLLPMYQNFDTSALKITVNGAIDASKQYLVINAPLVVEQEGDPEFIPYIISSVADQIAIIKAYFAEVTFAEGVEESITSWMMIILNHPDAELYLMNITATVTDTSFIRILAGKLVVQGGSFSASQSGILFELQGNATVQLSGGNYSIQDEGARFVAFASRVDAANVSMENISLTVGLLGQSPLEIEAEMSMDQLVIHGLSGITLNTATTYNISSIADIESIIRTLLEQTGIVSSENLVVELTSWVPIYINHPDAVVNVTGGEYISFGDFMFKVTAGKLNITGGSFNVGSGNFINLLGTGGEVVLAPADGSEIVTSTVTNTSLIRVLAGKLVVEGGSFSASHRGILVDVQGSAIVQLKGGDYSVQHEAARLISFASSIYSANVSMHNINLTVGVRGQSPLEINVEMSMDQLIIHGLSGITIDKAGTYNISSLADIEGFIRPPLEQAGFATNLVVDLTSWVPIHINHADAVVNIMGGEYSCEGEFTFKITAGKLNIYDATFNIGAGDFIYVGGETTITFGDENDSTKCPVVNAGKGVNVVHVAKVKTALTIYNGRFVKTCIDRDNYTSPLFFFDNIGDTVANASTFTIYDGYFEATRILQDYYGRVTTTIYDGTFTSNMVVDKLTDADYTDAYFAALQAATKENPFVFKPASHIDVSNAYILNTRGVGSYLNIYGGSFDGKYGYAILYSNGGSGATFNFYGGYFTGGYFWFFTNRIVTLNFESWINGAGEEISPTFEAKDSFTDHGFNIMRDSEEKGNSNNPKITIKAGTFAMKDLSGRNMWNFGGPTDVKIYGGTFTILPDSTVKDKDRAVYAALFRTDNCTGFEGTTNMDVYGGVFNAASIFYYRYGGGTLNIYAGTFRSNYKSTFVHGNARMLWLAHNDAIFNIYGGNFRANEYTYAIFSTDTANGGTMQLNIYGGTMTGGCRWMQIFKPAIITIDKNPLKDDPAYASYKLHDPKFEELSPQSDSTVYGFYIHGNFYGGTLNINYIDIELDAKSVALAVMVLEGGIINFNPASKNDIKIDIVRNRLFQITNAFRGHITINGGNYNSRESADMFYITTMMSAVNETNLMNSTLTIEGGNFTCFDNSTMFNVKCEVAEYTIRIKGGNFVSDKARTFFLNGYEDSAFGMATTFIVDGGTFTSKSARMIYLDHNAAPLIINGGLFLFEDRQSNATGDDAIIYAAGKQKSTVLIQGGTFVDNRDSDQSIINMNGNANIRLEGDFKLYVLEKKPYFIKNTITPAQSIPMLESNIGEYKNNPYYVCFGYYTQYAPIMVTRPELRTVLGAEGITFTSRISAENAAHLATLGTVTYGTLIFPTASLVGGWQYGTDFLDALIESGSKYKMVEAKNGIVTEDDGSLTIRASLIGIKEKNYTKSFTGIAYAKVTDGNGNETYYWATHISAGVSVTIREVAELAINDTNSAPIVKNGRVYCYVSILKDKTYSRFSSAFQQSLRKYLPASIKPKS